MHSLRITTKIFYKNAYFFNPNFNIIVSVVRGKLSLSKLQIVILNLIRLYFTHTKNPIKTKSKAKSVGSIRFSISFRALKSL